MRKTQPETKPERIAFDAWRRTTASGETKKIIVGRYWNDPERIEAKPTDLITDPDAQQ